MVSFLASLYTFLISVCVVFAISSILSLSALKASSSVRSLFPLISVLTRICFGIYSSSSSLDFASISFWILNLDVMLCDSFSEKSSWAVVASDSASDLIATLQSG